MDPVDEYAHLKSEMRRLQDRLEELREGFLRPGARLRSNQYEVQVRRQRRRILLKDRLPPEILRDSRFWEERENAVVTFRELDTGVRVVRPVAEAAPA